jgi:hypothetical protein
VACIGVEYLPDPFNGSKALISEITYQIPVVEVGDVCILILLLPYEATVAVGEGLPLEVSLREDSHPVPTVTEGGYEFAHHRILRLAEHFTPLL